MVYTSTNVISLFRFKLDFPNITNIYILTPSLRVGYLDHTLGKMLSIGTM